MPYTPGPFVAPHLYLQWGGSLPGNETWSNGVRLSQVNTGPWPLTDSADMLAAAVTAIKAFHGRANSKISNYCQLQYVKLNPIATSGLYAQSTTNEAVFADWGGIGTETRYPNQIALVATLRTAVSRGPASKGRFYIPMPSMFVGTDGLITDSDADGVAASATQLLTDLNAIRTNYAVAVHSRKLGAPAQRPVTSIVVGKVLDTQRRRRRSLIEGY